MVATCRFGRVAAVAAPAAVRAAVAVVVVSAVARTVAVVVRAVSASVDQSVVASVAQASKGCRRRCPESRVRGRRSAIVPVVLAALARRLAIGLVARVPRSATAQVVPAARAPRLPIVARVRAVLVAPRWAIGVRVPAARRR